MEVAFTGSKEEWDKQVADWKSTKETESSEDQLFNGFGLELPFAYVLFFSNSVSVSGKKQSRGTKSHNCPQTGGEKVSEESDFFPLHLLLFSPNHCLWTVY